MKDLRIEEAPAASKENQPPMPNDPAIVGVSYLSLVFDDFFITKHRPLVSLMMNHFGC